MAFSNSVSLSIALCSDVRFSSASPPSYISGIRKDKAFNVVPLCLDSFRKLEMAVLREMRYIHVLYAACFLNEGKDFQSCNTISWNKSLRCSASRQYTLQTLKMRARLSLTNAMN